jgi:hypothetical protein
MGVLLILLFYSTSLNLKNLSYYPIIASYFLSKESYSLSILLYSSLESLVIFYVFNYFLGVDSTSKNLSKAKTSLSNSSYYLSCFATSL